MDCHFLQGLRILPSDWSASPTVDPVVIQININARGLIPCPNLIGKKMHDISFSISTADYSHNQKIIINNKFLKMHYLTE